MSAVMEEKTFRGLREIAVLGFFAVALFLLISLVTFSNEDAGWTHSGAVQTVTNACGVFGAWISDFTLSFFGLCAYLFPFIIFWHGYLLYDKNRANQQKMTIVLRLLGSIAVIVAAAALSYLHIYRVRVELPGTTGGYLGQETGDKTLLLFGNSGSTLFLIVLLLSGITLATNISWVNLIDSIGKYTVFFWRIISNGFTDLSLERSGNSIHPLDIADEKPEPRKKPNPKAIPPVEKNAAQSYEKTSKPTPKQPSPNYKTGEDVLPSLALLDERNTQVIGYSQTDLEEMSRLVEDILADFNVTVTVVGFHPGPVITRFELHPAAGV